MKLQVGKILTHLDGEELTNPKGFPATLGWLCCEALLGVIPEEGKISGEEKIQRYELANRIYNEECFAEVSIEDLALIKKLISYHQSPLVAGQALKIIENN